MRHIIPISGKDSLATAILQTALKPNYDYEYIYNPTGLELPEVFEWIDKVEQYLGKPIVRVGNPLKPIIKEYNYFLPSRGARSCTRKSKIEPFLKYLGDDNCIVYYGIRADENRVGFDNSLSKNITPKYPLQDKGIDINGVYILLNSKGLKPPTFYWPQLHKRVTKILSYDPKEMIPEWIFDQLFAWRTRANCDRCFNQRKYEWIGLLLFHPELYWDASRMEKLGAENFSRKPKKKIKEQLAVFSENILDDLTKDEMAGQYTFASDKEPLEDLAKRVKQIFNKRAYQVAEAVNNLTQKSLFKDEADSEIYDVLSVSSCGLMCGK